MTLSFVVLILAAPFALLAWLVIDALRNGVVRMQLGSYSRAEEPALFWATVGVYVSTMIVGAYIVVPMFLPQST